MAWSCCKDDIPEPTPMRLEVPSPVPRIKNRDVLIGYVLEHQEDDDEVEERKKELEKAREQEQKRVQEQEQKRVQEQELIKVQEQELKKLQEQELKKLQEQELKKVQEREPVQVQEQDKTRRPSKGQDDDIEKPCTSKDDWTEAETQTNPRYFPKSAKKVTLDEILIGMQKIEYTITITMKDFEQRLSRLEQIVLKMRNAWIHHRTCHLEGLEYDDEQETFS